MLAEEDLVCAAVAVLPLRGAEAVQFGPLTDLQTGIGFTTVLTLGPEDPDLGSHADGCIYAVNGGTGASLRYFAESAVPNCRLKIKIHVDLLDLQLFSTFSDGKSK